ncbi:hypothetical protein [Oculatella sp. LEGE 06141]|nr:hypothetical protein [Oculatella sp. LEGE 06141]
MVTDSPLKSISLWQDADGEQIPGKQKGDRSSKWHPPWVFTIKVMR